MVKYIVTIKWIEGEHNNLCVGYYTSVSDNNNDIYFSSYRDEAFVFHSKNKALEIRNKCKKSYGNSYQASYGVPANIEIEIF